MKYKYIDFIKGKGEKYIIVSKVLDSGVLGTVSKGIGSSMCRIAMWTVTKELGEIHAFMQELDRKNKRGNKK